MGMQLKFWRAELNLTHQWTIARGSASKFRVVFVELRDRDGVVGYGETAPSRRYQETIETVEAFFSHIDPAKLSFSDLAASKEYVEKIAPDHLSAKGAIDLALWDGAGKIARKPTYDALGLGFREGAHTTSFSIGIDSPEVIREKVKLAEGFPILKLKMGVKNDKENLKALREIAPTKTVRVDANEGWKTREQALEMLEFLAADKNIEFCEQPMPTTAAREDMAWLKKRSPLPLMGDESYVTDKDLTYCAEFFHAVNVKLVKAGGISGAMSALKAARKAGMKTMLGCMIESSVLISAAAQLAELTDYLDLDGNILISNDPFTGPSADKGIVSFKNAQEPFGLRVKPRELSP
jgi:L-alanine-DL-glutamate epimerase-like enolase superfamily enzyme